MHNSSEESKNREMDPGLKNGMIFDVTIEDVTVEGFGTTLVNGFRVHVPHLAPGDQARVRIEHVSRQAMNAWARPLEEPRRGDKWKRHFCKEAEQAGGRCGGCPLGHLAADAYREVKLDSIAQAFAQNSISPVPDVLVIGQMRKYRNKSNFVVHRMKKGQIHLGSFAPRSHRFANMTGCAINAAPITRLQQDIEMLFEQNNASVHPAPSGIRYVTVKTFSSGAALLDVVVGGDITEEIKNVGSLLRDHSMVHGVSVTANSTDGNQVRGTGSHHVIGRDALHDRVGDIQLWMTATTFFQLNSEMATRMYQMAATWCANAGCVWDLYCGIGGLGLTVAKATGAKVFGGDSIEGSIALANRNAAENALDATFETVDLSNAFPASWPSCDVALVNPPRRGIDPFTLEKLCASRIPKLIYMSCNPASFARDARAMLDAGYVLDNIAAFDMLPNTSHVELLGLFRLN